MIDDESSVCLTVDNTPPDISGSVSTNPIKSGDALKIKVFSNIWYRYTPDDTANITATIFGKEFNIPLSSYSGGSMGKLEYTIPQVSDGVYSVFLTAEDMVGNSKTISVNYTVDNTPPIITATIAPDTLKFIDFANDRSLEIIAQSSTDTKAIYVFIDNSWRFLKYLNGFWTNKFGVPHIVSVGIHTIQLKAIDYAGNEEAYYVTYKAVDFLGSITPPSGTGIGDGSSGSSGDGRSSGSSVGGSQGGSSEGSDNESPGNSPDSNESPTSPDYTILLIILLVVILLLLLIFLWYIGALPILWLFLEILVFSIIRGFVGLLGMIMECLASIGWLFLGEGIIINPFTFILQLFTLGVMPSISGVLQVIISLLGGRFASIAPIAEAVEAGLYSYGIVEFAESVFELGDKFKKWLGLK
ncbi:MAG: hypothetical protein GX432_03810 [Candidatus Atribacteria bacterium]|nr:hypothetical protein [Candidatus Atribacteria bacterium]